MTEPAHKPRRVWESPWFITVGGGTIAGVTGGWLSHLSPLYIIAPAFVVALALSALVLARKLARRLREFRLWQDATSERVLWLHDQLQQLALRSLIHEARVLGWEVVSLAPGAGLVFTSPEGDVLSVEPGELDPDQIATELHAAAPRHFKDRWMPSELRSLVDNEIQTKQLIPRVEKLETEAAKSRTRYRPAEAGLADLLSSGKRARLPQ